jgi:protein-disulfide isomerase
MHRTLLAFLAAVCLLPAADPKSALDKKTMETYVRHLFVFPPPVKLEVLDPQPSDLPGFLEVVVRASNADASRDFPFLVSKDGQKIVQGSVFDVNSNPFKKDLEKLKTASQPDIGTPGASVVLVEFSDFQCSYCKQEAQTLKQNLLSAYPKQVRLYFKDFPLEQIHPWAKTAAVAGRCVYRQNAGAFWSYHDWIFEHQSEITAQNLKDKIGEWAKTAKDVDFLRLGRCIDARETEAEVNQNLAEGKALGITATPTLFINGRRLSGQVDWPTLRSIIDQEIEYQKTAKNAGEDCGCEVKLDIPGVPATGASPPGLKRP